MENKNIHFAYGAAIVVLLVLLYLMFNGWMESKAIAGQKQGVINSLQSEIKYRTNYEGRVIAERTAAQADLNTLKESFPKLVEEINRKLEVKTKNILAAVQSGIDVRGVGSVKIIHDTIPGINGEPIVLKDTIKIMDGYLKLQGQINNDDVFSYFDYKYQYTDTLLLSFSSKKHFFKGETLTFSGVLANPHAKLSNTTAVMVHKIKPKRFNISIGVYFDPLKQQYGPAITAGYSLLRL